MAEWHDCSLPIIDFLVYYSHVTRAVPNIRFVFASDPNSYQNSLFVFDRIVHPKSNTNSSMTLTCPRRDERTAVGTFELVPHSAHNHCGLAPPPRCNLIGLRWCGGGTWGSCLGADSMERLVFSKANITYF